MAKAKELNFERVVFFSDAVFAIVITLLVLPLTEQVNFAKHGLAGDESELWGRLLTFGISFLVIGQFWVAHHRLFGHLHDCDLGLLWLNLISLMSICFLPFPTAYMGSVETSSNRAPVVLYAASMTFASVALNVTWLYAVRQRFVVPEMTAEERRVFTDRSLATNVVFAASIPVALLGLLPAALVWLLGLPLGRAVYARLRRREPSS